MSPDSEDRGRKRGDEAALAERVDALARVLRDSARAMAHADEPGHAMIHAEDAARACEELAADLARSPLLRGADVADSPTPLEFAVPIGHDPVRVARDAALRLSVVLEADRVLVLGLDGQEFRILAHAASPLHGRPPSFEEPTRVLREVSRTVLDECVRHRRVWALDDVAAHPELGEQVSVVRHGIRSVMAAPLLGADDDVVGVLYVDRRATDPRPFTDVQGQLFRKLAGIVASALETAETLHRSRPAVSTPRDGAFGAIIGRSDAIRSALDRAAAFAGSRAALLLVGEPGTGKELFAQGIHRCGPWSDAPFVRLQGPLLHGDTGHAEIQGWNRGAFTGADADHAGAFERAGSGTVFIDEVGDLDSRAQAALLGALDPGTVRRIRGEFEIPVTARVIAATNRDLGQMVADGRFRRDLRDRLSALVLRIPPVRDRRDDVSDLFRHLVERAAPGSETPPEVTREVESVLARLPLSGNVRELRNLAERAVALCRHERVNRIEARHLALDEAPVEGPSTYAAFKRSLREAGPDEKEASLVEWLDRWHRWSGADKRRFADGAGLSRETIYRLLRRVPGRTRWAARVEI